MTATPDPAALERNAETCRVLGHETRLRLLLLLATREHSVGEIEAASGVGQPGLSQQLAILRKAGVVTTRRVAKQVYYSIDPAGLAETRALLERLCGVPVQAAETTIKTLGPGIAAQFARIV